MASDATYSGLRLLKRDSMALPAVFDDAGSSDPNASPFAIIDDEDYYKIKVDFFGHTSLSTQ